MKKLENDVFSYPTKHKMGFIESEIKDLLEKYGLTEEQWNSKFGIHTVALIDDETVYYHTDVLLTIKLCLQNREMKPFEWD